MIHRTKVAFATLAVLGGVALHAVGQDAPKTGGAFELRRAETEPAKGLTPAIVEGTKTKIYLHKEAALTSKDVSGAQLTKDNAEKPAVEITFTAKGAEKLAKIAESHLGKPLAMIVGGKVIFAPTVRSKIEGPKVLVTGSFTAEEAEKIVKGVQMK